MGPRKILRTVWAVLLLLFVIIIPTGLFVLGRFVKPTWVWSVPLVCSVGQAFLILRTLLNSRVKEPERDQTIDSLLDALAKMHDEIGNLQPTADSLHVRTQWNALKYLHPEIAKRITDMIALCDGKRMLKDLKDRQQGLDPPI